MTIHPRQGLESTIILPEQTYENYYYPELLVDDDLSYLNKEVEKARAEISEQELIQLTLRQAVDFFHLLNYSEPYDGTGKKLSRSRINAILDKSLRTGSKYRSEWFDALLTQEEDQFFLTYHKFQSDGSLQQVTHPLDECLMLDSPKGISLEHWLKNSTNQGFPPSNIPQGKLRYFCPQNDMFVRLTTTPTRAYLNCKSLKRLIDPNLGIRLARIRQVVS